MFRRVADFEKSWTYDGEATLKILRTLTDASLAQAISPEDRTLGRLAWHVTCTIPETYGERWTRGYTLQALVGHQVHRRGQMTVLMRQAGLRVPGVFAREEWSAFGMAAPKV